MRQREVPMVRQPPSRGGQANEAGSLHRSGIAAYLAAHGLAGRGVEAAGYPESGPTPVTLAFETGEDVDDILCGLADETALLLQAKRTCGADKHLKATVTQWAGQIAHLRPSDRVGLATAQPKGPVKELAAALERRRRPVPGPFPPGEEKALAAVRARLPADTSEQITERALGAAIVMAVASSSPSDEGFRSAANMLDGTVVPAGSGSRAIAALQHAFQQQAAAGTGSSLDEWLQVLTEAGLEVIADADGTAGQRRRAELDAVAAHRARLASRDGILEFSLLAEDLPPMTYKPLADSLRVSVPGRDHSDDFLRVARRWPRMLLVGLPGMGKSTALEQSAARWAADSRAPVPVVIPLRDVAGRQPRRRADVTLPVLIEAATATAPQRERQPLRRGLEHAASAGEAVLLLDGLDECRELRGVVADGLAEIAGELPPDTGVVLATRDSSLPAARKLKLAEAQLAEPAWLELALSDLLRHVATSRGVPDCERDRWVGDRRRRLDEIRRGHPDLWRVPLLATLLTLLAARREPAELPVSRARLLAEAVRDTVNRWELSRLADPPPYPHLREHLLDGYNEIAHTILSGSGGCPKATVKRKVAAMLAARWGMASAEARTHAGWVLWFWDEHVGVFVASPATGDIEPRSRVFAEAGDAMWAAGQDAETRREWITGALADGDRREPVVLAASLSADVANELIEAASQAATPAARAHALWWAADSAADGAEPSATARRTLLGGLAQAAREAAARVPAPVETGKVTARKRRAVRPGWGHVLKIAMLPLPGTLRSRRDAILAGLVLDGTEQALAAALTALADARADARDELTPGEAAAVSRLLDIPLPERKPPATTPEGAVILSGSSELLGGQFMAAEQAASYAPQLGQKAVDAIYRIAHRGSVDEYDRVVIRLTALGFPDPEPFKYPDMTEFVERMTHVWDGWEEFLKAASSLASPGPSSLAEGWRYPHLAALANVLNAPKATLDGIDHTLTTNQAMLPGWIRATSHAAGLDLTAISAQAAAALNAWSEGNQDVIDIMFAPSPSPPPACDPARLDPDDVDVLIEALGATSQWLADTACILLESAHDFAIGERAEARIPLIPPDRRQHATHVAIANNPSPPAAAGRLLDSRDPLVRVGAAAAASALADNGDASPWTPVLARARADDDLTVQLAAAETEAGPITAARWTCLDCGGINEIAAPECALCASGARPGVRVLSTP
jgi:NACHT domain